VAAAGRLLAATLWLIVLGLARDASALPAATPNLPPPGAYVSPADWHAAYAAGIIISNVSHDRFTTNTPPPPPSGTQVHSFGSHLFLQVSADGGATFQDVHTAAAVSARVTSAEIVGNTRYFDTEMLQLDISGGGLPPNVRIRESPTRASLGRTSIAQLPGGGFEISSFFDIFTELSLDNGQTWEPTTNGAVRMGLPPGPCPTPVISCPPDITATTCSNCARVLYPLPTVTPATASLVCVPPPGSCFPVGTTVVTCTASDNCGAAQCSFRVTVVLAPPISIECPTNPIVVTVPCGTNCVPVNYPPPVVNNGTLVGCNPPSGACLPVGLHTVTCRATNDCGSVAGCEFQIRVNPSQGNPPSIQCPPDISVTTCSNCAVVNYAVPVGGPGVTVTCAPPPGHCFPIGSSVVTCTATDNCGASATCSFKVEVRDVPPATITCPSNIVVTLPCGSNCVPVIYPAPVVSGGGLLGCIPPSGACLPVGIHAVTCRATNVCGDVSGCEFQIRVNPGQGNPPTITCPSDITVETCGNCQVVNYPAPTVVNGALAGCNPPSGHCFPIGTTVVTCFATNNCGGTALCEFRVTVRPEGPASIVCPNDITVTTCGNCEVVNYPPPTVSNGTLVGCAPPSGFCFPLGTTTVNCRATNDCGSITNCKFNVTVREVPPVSIICPSNIVVTTCTNGEVVTYPPPTIIGGPAVAVTCSPASGSFFPLGTTTVTCCAVDQCHRTNCCSFTVTVIPGNPCVKPPLNMVLWLPFDEPAGPIANNIVAGTPDGLHVNGPTPFLGQHVLNSLCFDGLNDYVRVPNYAAIVLSFSHFSIDTWALRRDPATGGRRVIVSKMRQVQGGVAGYEFYLNNGVMNLLLRTPLGAFNFNSGVVVPQDNNWHFLAVTVQRGAPNVVRFYLDGNPVAVVAGALNGGVGNSSPLLVGSRSFPGVGDFFSGCLDELEIFRRVLTPLEIQQLWRAGRAGKCKIRKIIPWDVPFPPGSNCITVNVTICNDSAVPQPILWNASGPLPILTPSGNVVVPPFTCVTVPVTLCRPTNGVPVGSAVIWNFTISGPGLCPMTMMGSVINPGPIVVVVPVDPVPIPGTNVTRRVPISLNGLPPGQPIRLRAIGPDMEPDQVAVSLNGLPPGTPWIIGGGGFVPAADNIPVPVQFVDADPIGLYTILVEVDLDGDGDFDTLVSFDVTNPAVPPPTLSIRKVGAGRVQLDWSDEGDGLGTLESAPVLEGQTDVFNNELWTPVPGGVPGIILPASERQHYFRVAMPID